MKKVFVYKSISQKIRAWLDAPLAKKGFLFWLFSPFLFFCSFMVSCVASMRRRRGYAKFENLSVAVPSQLRVVCVGNVLMGGTGKSPLVRALAEKYLSEDRIVAIASRGIASEPIVIDSENFNQCDVDMLSDENREHFELLRFKFPTKQFFIYQNKDRRKSLCEFIKNVNKEKKYFFIMDDGLQHFSCPRHENICIGNQILWNSAPPFSFPVGPYREGFGRLSLEKIIATFDFKFDVNTQSSARIAQIDEARSIQYQLQFVQLNFFENGKFKFQFVDERKILSQLKGVGLVIAGIANPERFLNNLKLSVLSDYVQYDTILLADHGEVTPLCLNKFENSQFLILTFKDFCRFCTHPKFLQLCATREVYACYPEYKLDDANQT